MRHIRKKLGICLVMALVIAAAVFAMPQDASATVDLKAGSKAVSKSSVKLTWSLKDSEDTSAKAGDAEADKAAATAEDAAKSIVKWKVFCAKVDKNDKAGDFRKIKTLKKDKRSCTLKKLEPKTKYRFRICGYVKKDGELTKAYTAETDNYTGLAKPKWAEGAETRYAVSAAMIEVAIQPRESYGLPAEGYQIYRKALTPEKTAEKATEETKPGETVKTTAETRASEPDKAATEEKPVFKKIASVEKSDKNSDGIIVYRDETVQAGKTYEYKVRAYKSEEDSDGTEKTKYSGFCKPIKLTAFNEEGIYKITNVRFTSQKMVIRLDSDPNNAKLKLDTHNIFYGDAEEYEDPVVIKRWSRDGEHWNNLETLTPEQEADGVKAREGVNYLLVKGGDQIYLKFVAVESDTDLKELGYQFKTTDALYRGQEKDFGFSLTGKGYARTPEPETEE